jgi:hypothetical protein
MSYAERFLDGYIDAWRTNDPDSIRALFAPDATYRSGVRDLEPATGADAIVAHWLEERDEPGTWSYSGAVELQTEKAAVIRGVTTYTDGPKSGVYANVWLVRFAEDGRASEFQDWWFPQEG